MVGHCRFEGRLLMGWAAWELRPDAVRRGLTTGTLLLSLAVVGCQPAAEAPEQGVEPAAIEESASVTTVTTVTGVAPRRVSEPVGQDEESDSDDPAFWIHPEDPAQSLVLGTDKAGGVIVYNLEGKIQDATVRGLGRVNNVDVEYGFRLAGEEIDLAIATDRDGGVVHLFRLPEMIRLSPEAGLPVFEGETGERAKPMGVALYKRPADGALFAVLSRKSGPEEGYLWQYRLMDGGDGTIGLEKVREFGAFSGGEGEIEAIVVDDAMGYVYYSDEWAGVRKYQADPEAENAQQELAIFGTEGFADDREGISIYPTGEGTGYILVSDQQAGSFRVFPRQGSDSDAHAHPELGVIDVQALDSDGSEVSAELASEAFPGGLFVAMSDDKTFHFYAWDDLWSAMEPSPGTP